MGCIRLRFLSLVLLICSVTLADSIASARSVVEVLTEKNGGAMGVDEEVLPGSTTSRSRWLWGRKMSAERLEKKGTVETGAKPYAGKCKHGGKRGTNLESVTSLHSRVKLVRHIPFSSDYRGPKTHPPKNN